MYFLMFNQGLCSFENGFCGLKQDNSMENRWDLNFGHTPSTNTGPRYDHTTYSQKGIFFLVITPLDYKENCFYQTALLIFDLVEQVLTFIQKLLGVVTETAHV